MSQDDYITVRQGSHNVGTRQFVAPILSCMVGTIIGVLGLALLSVPWTMIHIFISCNDSHVDANHNNMNQLSALSLTLARLAGGSFFALAASSLSFLLPTIIKNKRALTEDGDDNDDINHKCRSCLFSQAILGVTMVVIGLLDERNNNNNNNDDDGSQKSFCNFKPVAWILGFGAIILVLACGALMISFWPVVEETEEQSSTTDDSSSSCRRFFCCCRKRRRTVADNVEYTQGDSAMEPLLRDSVDIDEEAQEEAEVNYHLLEDTPTSEEEGGEESLPPLSGNVEDHSADVATSRITGTRRLIKLAAPQMFYLYIGCAVLLIRLPFSLSIPHFVSTTLGALGRGDYTAARTEILLLFILGTIDAALDFWCVFLFGYAKERIVRGVRIDTFRSILKQEVSFFDSNTSGDLSSRLNSDCGEMAGDLTWFFRFSIESVVRITGIAMYMLIRSPTLGGCALVIVPIVGVVNKLYGDWLRKNAIAVQNALAKANSVAQEAFSCVRTVIAFATEKFEEHKYTDEIDNQYHLNVRQLYFTGVYYMVISTFLINTCVQAALLLIGTYLIQKGQLQPEVLLAFMLYQGQLQNETLNLFQSYSSLVKSSGAGDKVFALLDRTPLPPGTGNPDVVLAGSQSDDENNNDDDDSDTRLNHHAQSNVELRGLHFFYNTRSSHKVLKGLNLDIRAGSTVALVGPSGCGKSTVMGLLQRFYDPTFGKVLIDGTDLRSMDIQKYRRHIGTVTQDPVLFSGTISSNIAYGIPSATRDDVIKAAKLANAHSFISVFPDGYDTEVGERGTKLSGGQKQRIAIARAVMKNPSLLLLDEATSALDAESEQVVQDALDELLKKNKDMTTVIVAHRLRTVRHADCIAFIENGCVAEQGTHEELMELPGGKYRRMVERAGTNGMLPDR